MDGLSPFDLQIKLLWDQRPSYCINTTALNLFSRHIQMSKSSYSSIKTCTVSITKKIIMIIIIGIYKWVELT